MSRALATVGSRLPKGWTDFGRQIAILVSVDLAYTMVRGLVSSEEGIAMIHGRLGEKEQARKWYDQAVQWMEKNDPDDGGLKSMRAEAAELLGVKESAPLENWLKQLIKRGLAQ